MRHHSLSQNKNKSDQHTLALSSAWLSMMCSDLPSSVLQYGVDVLLQHLFGLQFMNLQSTEQLAHLRVTQLIQTFQQPRLYDAQVLVQIIQTCDNVHEMDVLHEGVWLSQHKSAYDPLPVMLAWFRWAQALIFNSSILCFSPQPHLPLRVIILLYKSLWLLLQKTPSFRTYLTANTHLHNIIS